MPYTMFLVDPKSTALGDALINDMLGKHKLPNLGKKKNAHAHGIAFASSCLGRRGGVVQPYMQFGDSSGTTVFDLLFIQCDKPWHLHSPLEIDRIRLESAWTSGLCPVGDGIMCMYTII